VKLDETDLKIIELLRVDARLSYSEIARQVHLTRVAARERVLSLEKNGVILGYTVQINSAALNRGISIFIDIEIEPCYVEIISKNLVENKDIAIVSQHTGQSGLHVHAYISGTAELSKFLEDNIYNLKGVLSVKTSLLIKHYKTNAFMC